MGFIATFHKGILYTFPLLWILQEKSSHTIVHSINFKYWLELRARSNFMELLEQLILLHNCLLSINEQDTGHKSNMWNGYLAGYLNIVSMIYLCLATFCAKVALWNWAPMQTNCCKKLWATCRSNFIELLEQLILLPNCLLSIHEQDTSHKSYMWNGYLAGLLIIPVSII